MTSDQFLVFGHRGSPRTHTENTIASFRAALDHRADGFETDLRQLADGAIVLFHDASIDGKPLQTLGREELATLAPDVPALEDLSQLEKEGTLILEVKEIGFEEQIAEIVEGWSDVVVCSFETAVIEAFSEKGVGFDLGLTVREYRIDLAAHMAGLGASWFFPRWNVIDDEVVARFHDAGARVIPWTANRPNQWSRLVDIGCDGVISDVPAEAAAWREGRS